MARNPEKLTVRPAQVDGETASATDILGDLLSSLRFTTIVYGHLELGAPWGLSFPSLPASASLIVIARGSAQLEVEASDQTTVLSAGDVALLPSGGAHVLRDGKGSPLHVLGASQCQRATATNPIRLGGKGARTTLVAGAFRYGSGHRIPLFETLPPVIHIAASDGRASPWLSSTVQLLIAESAARSPGGTVVVSRLVDVLFVQALRTFIMSTRCKESGLRALGDAQIGKALQLVHERPAEPWTVEGLARAVGLSRSAFAARFTELVGESPLGYVSRWRMTKAAELLRESDLSMLDVAERAGYRSEAAFNRAFKRHEGTAPARYRRQQANART
jgi:AraC-like DNA-binding protein/mannose-6-phosphate isomerase-like protein (cupin superfamily)